MDFNTRMLCIWGMLGLSLFLTFVMYLCGFEAARKFRRRENGQTDVEEGRCNCSHSRESHLSGTCHVNQGHIFTITGRRTDRNARRANEPPPAFSDCIKDDKDLPKYEEVIENPHLYNIAKEVEV